MAFLYPAALWGLAAVPLLFFLNVFRHRRVKVTVSSHAIWRTVLEKHAQAPRSRGRFFNIELMLEIVIIVLVVLALAGPVVPASPGGQWTVFVIDASSSMNAAPPGGRSRFSAAVEKARSMLGRMTASDRAVFFITPSAGRVTAGVPLAREDALHALGLVEPTDAPDDLDAVVRSAAVLAVRENASLVILSDKPAHAPDGIPVRFDRPLDFPALPNVAITALGARGDAVFVQVSRTNDAPGDVRLRVSDNTAKEIDQSIRVAFEKNITRKRFVVRVHDVAEFVKARIEIPGGDSIPADDAAYLFRASSGAPRIALFGDVPGSIERALRSAGGVELVRILEGAPAGRFVWRVYGRMLPAEDPGGNVLLLDPPAGRFRDIDFAGRIPVSATAPSADSPLGKEFVFRIPGVNEVRAIKGAHSVTNALGNGVSTPALFLKQDGAGIAAGLAFDVEKTAWSAEASFPVFFARLLEYAGGDMEWRTLKTGTAFRVNGEIFSGKKIDPSGKEFRIQRHGAGAFIPYRAGKLELATSAGAVLAGASILDFGESHPTGVSAIVPEGPVPMRPAKDEDAALWHWFFIMALILVVMYWLIHRGRREAL